jgi:hypothetical protein
MKNRHPLMDQQVELEVSGKALPISGKLVEVGQDIIVLHNGKQFYYHSSLLTNRSRIAKR